MCQHCPTGCCLFLFLKTVSCKQSLPWLGFFWWNQPTQVQVLYLVRVLAYFPWSISGFSALSFQWYDVTVNYEVPMATKTILISVGWGACACVHSGRVCVCACCECLRLYCVSPKNKINELNSTKNGDELRAHGWRLSGRICPHTCKQK